MLSKILSKSDCAKCKFCCVFQKSSLWETPLFANETAKWLSEKFPRAVFKQCTDNCMTVDLSQEYDDNIKEAKCFFLGEEGCLLSDDDKPFDCKIWPLRVMDKDGEIVIALTPTCKIVNKYKIDDLKKIVLSENLHSVILAKVKTMPDMIKPYREDFPVLYSFPTTNN